MLQTLRNAWKVPELRKKLIFTLVCLVIFRLGSAILIPFINRDVLQEALAQYENTILGFVNMMSGGGFENANIFALSVILPHNVIFFQLMLKRLPLIVYADYSHTMYSFQWS